MALKSSKASCQCCKSSACSSPAEALPVSLSLSLYPFHSASHLFCRPTNCMDKGHQTSTSWPASTSNESTVRSVKEVGCIPGCCYKHECSLKISSNNGKSRTPAKTNLRFWLFVAGLLQRFNSRFNHQQITLAAISISNC